MKNLVLALLLFCLASPMLAQWEQTNGPEGTTPHCLSNSGTRLWLGAKGGLYMSLNQGASWSRNPHFNTSVFGIYSAADTIVAIYWVSLPGYPHPLNVYSETSFDHGLSWGAPTLVMDSCFSQSNYPTLKKVNDDIICFFGSNIALSSNMGQSWSRLQAPPLGLLAGCVASDDKTVIVRARHVIDYFFYEYITQNNGTTWRLLDSTVVTTSYLLHDSVIVKNKRYLTDSLFRSTDLGYTWQFIDTFNTTFTPIQYYNGMMWALDYPDYYVSLDDGLTWAIQAEEPNYYFSPIDLPNGDILDIKMYSGVIHYVVANDTFYYSNAGLKSDLAKRLVNANGVLIAAGYYNFSRSTDGGNSWQSTFYSDDIYNVTKLIAANDTVLALGGIVLFRSFDAGLSWDTLHAPAYFINAGDNDLIYSNGSIFISSPNYGSYVSHDVGNTWQALPDFTPLQSDKGGRLAIVGNTIFGMNNNGAIYSMPLVGGQGWSLIYHYPVGGEMCPEFFYNDGCLYAKTRYYIVKSTDLGASWDTLNCAGLPADDHGYFYHSKFLSSQGVLFLLVSGEGVYVCSDGGNIWHHITSGFNTSELRDIAIVQDKLFLGTRYNGVWRRNGTFAPVTGRVFLDNNNNQIADPGEQGLPGTIINDFPGGFFASTDLSGMYTLVTDAVNDSIYIGSEMRYATAVPSYYIATSPATGLDFAYQLQPNVLDREIYITAASVFRPGFYNQLVISCRNTGSIFLPAEIRFLPDNRLGSVTYTPVPSYFNGDTAVWLTDTLHYMESNHINVYCNTPVNLTQGDTIFCEALVENVVGDSTPINNFFGLTEPVMASYDPNDKSCLQGDYITLQEVQEAEEMVYTIRFQNLGNYQADFISISDTLNPNLDIGSFRLISSSHPVTWSLSGHGIATFHFDDIFLPPAMTDEPGSHGFVRYGLKCRPEIGLGTALTNTAYIYFDFNQPIITNTITTLVSMPVITSMPGQPEDFEQNPIYTFYPNPANDILNIGVENVSPSRFPASAELYDLSGQLLISQTFQLGAGNLQLSLSELASGFYVCLLRDATGRVSAANKIVIFR